MYDIICDIWKNPGAAFSPMPMWVWNRMPEADELVRQIDDFHKKGIDGLVIKPGEELGDAYLSEEYFSLVKAALDAAKKRFMLVVFADGRDHSCGAHGEYVRNEKRLSVRRLYPLPTGSVIPDDEDVLFRIFVKLEEGLLVDVSLAPNDGYTAYDLVLGYTDGAGEDLLNPAYADSLLGNTYEQYHSHFSEYFGQTVIGFLTENVPGMGKGYTPWSYNTAEAFMEEGGDFMGIASLLFDVKNKKIRREAEFTLQNVWRKSLNEAYLKPLARWCSEKGVGLFGYSTDTKNSDAISCMHFPGQYLGGDTTKKLLTTSESTAAKLAADCARHMGLSRSFGVLFDKCEEGWSLSPDQMMQSINYAVSRGCSMLIPCNFYYSVEDAAKDTSATPDVGHGNIWWKDYRKIAGYTKRMSWLGATGTNNPCAAVLCSPEYAPSTPVKALYANGYTFNYLTLDDFMDRAHIHDGEIHIDRYKYKLLLIDGRLRLNADIVLKIGKFITGGGVMFRGSDFIGAVRKNVKLTSYFEGESGGNIRFTEYNKSGCPFFLLINEGSTSVSGRLITNKGCAAAEFDPFTGKTLPMTCEMADNGFAYAVAVPPHSAKVIGMDPDALPKIGDGEEKVLSEIVSLKDGRMSFDYHPEEGKTANLSFTAIHDIADVSVNGQNAGRLIFMPYELDVTELLTDGENTVSVVLTESVGNEYGTPSPAGFEGCTVRVFSKK